LLCFNKRNTEKKQMTMWRGRKNRSSTQGPRKRKKRFKKGTILDTQPRPAKKKSKKKKKKRARRAYVIGKENISRRHGKVRKRKKT